mgnify:CR=1 FL=1
MPEKNKRKKYRWLALAVCITVLLSIVIAVMAVTGNSEEEVPRPVRAGADTSYRGWLTVSEENLVAAAEIAQSGESIGIKEEQCFTVSIPKSGDYTVVLTYAMEKPAVLDSTVTVRQLNAKGACVQSARAEVYSLWQDETKDYALDRYGNEVSPSQVVLAQDVTDYVREYSSADGSAVVFHFEEGNQTISILSNDAQILIKDVMVAKVPETVDYETYETLHHGEVYTGDPIIIEGEDYAVKNDSAIRSKAGSGAAVAPYHPYYKWMATVDGNSWKTVGQRVVWNFSVPADGWYSLVFHYSQSYKEGQEARRTIEIDGQVPYDALREVEFAYTGAKYAYRNAEGKVYLTAGEHTLGMYVEMPQMQPLIAQVERIMDDLQDVGLSLQQVAGSDADVSRTWEIEKYIPGVTDRLTNIQIELENLYSHMEQQYGDEPASSQNLKLAADILAQVLKEPEKLPTRTQDINVGSSSATSYLAELINGWKNQGLSLERIYLTGENASLPNPNGNFFVNLLNDLKEFFHSLLSKDAGYTTADSGDETVLTVWINRSVQYVEMIQTLCDSRYEGYTDADGNKITIQFSVMPDEGKLLLANASGTGPDVALGVSGDRPYQLALRGAIHPLSEFDDFAAFMEGKFLNEAFEPFIYNDNVYAMPETQQFNVLMYRTDIMERLGLEIPRTWEDVANMMPALRRNGMNFYMPLSSQTGTKSVENIAVFFWQAAAAKGEDPAYSLYSEDGMQVTLNNETNIEAFQILTDLYLLYGLQNNMPSFYNNFRYGVSPIGIGTFSNYVQMLYAAPEIADDWAIAPVPGFAAEDGTIYNQMTTIGSSAIIMQDSDKKEAAWDFIKWWLSDETQSEFAQTLQSKFGSSYIWNSANIHAFAELAIPEEDRAVILEQWTHTENIRHTPASYMLERSLSDAWYSVVNTHIPVRRALNEAAANTQQELTIKLQEFNYVGKSGEVIRVYSMKSLEEILALQKKNQ